MELGKNISQVVTVDRVTYWNCDTPEQTALDQMEKEIFSWEYQPAKIIVEQVGIVELIDMNGTRKKLYPNAIKEISYYSH